jgi:hypothetical protein
MVELEMMDLKKVRLGRTSLEISRVELEASSMASRGYPF